MQLTLYSDYSLRVLLYLAEMPNDMATISEIAEFYHISRNHLVKVVHQLSQLGFINSIRGKHGGIQLAMDPATINIGDVIRKTEKNFNLVECFDEVNNTCSITGHCRLKKILHQALQAYLAELDKYYLNQAGASSLSHFIEKTIAMPVRK